MSKVTSGHSGSSAAQEAAEVARIVLLATASAITYGLIHDQVTAHLCVEYFSVAHPPVFPTKSAFLLALGWGVIATWWVGLPLGIGLAAAARIGPQPRLSWADLQSTVFKLMLATAAAAVACGAIGAFLVYAGRAPVPGGWAAVIPPSKQIAFSADGWAHQASYAFGTIGGLVVIGLTVWRRRHGRSKPIEARVRLSVWPWLVVGGGFGVVAIALGWWLAPFVFPPSLHPPTPPLLEGGSEAIGSSHHSGCPPWDAYDLHNAGSIEQRVAKLFPTGTAQGQIIRSLSEQGFKIEPPCPSDPTVRYATFSQTGGGLFGPYPASSVITWQVDWAGRIVWASGWVAYTGP